MTTVLSDQFVVGLFTVGVVLVIAIIVFLSKTDKFTTGLQEGIIERYVSYVTKLTIHDHVYSDSSNIGRWKYLAHLLSKVNTNDNTIIQALRDIEQKLWMESDFTTRELNLHLELLCSLRTRIQQNLPAEIVEADVYSHPFKLHNAILTAMGSKNVIDIS